MTSDAVLSWHLGGDAPGARVGERVHAVSDIDHSHPGNLGDVSDRRPDGIPASRSRPVELDDTVADARIGAARFVQRLKNLVVEQVAPVGDQDEMMHGVAFLRDRVGHVSSLILWHLLMRCLSLRASLVPLRGVPDIDVAQSMCAACPHPGQEADDAAVFVTSANLTEAALDRNIELGLVIRDPTLAKTTTTHFQALIDRDLLRPLPEA